MEIDPCPLVELVVKDWTRRYRERLEQASREIQWEDRAEVLFWRGSDTGCLHSDVAKETLGRRNDKWNYSALTLSSVWDHVFQKFSATSIQNACQDLPSLCFETHYVHHGQVSNHVSIRFSHRVPAQQGPAVWLVPPGHPPLGPFFRARNWCWHHLCSLHGSMQCSQRIRSIETVKRCRRVQHVQLHFSCFMWFFCCRSAGMRL